MRQLQQGFAAHETVVRDQVAAFLRRGCRLWVKPGLQPMSALRPLIGPKQPKMVRVEAHGASRRIGRQLAPCDEKFAYRSHAT
jgi:hypothetical protein